MTNQALSVKVLDSSDDVARQRWDSFVGNSDRATFFHLSGWQQVLKASFGHACPFLYVEHEGEIEGVLPLVHVKSRLFSNALISTPFCVYGGPLTQTERARQALDEAACKQARSRGVEYLEMREREARRQGWPSKELYYTFTKPLYADDDANLKAIPRKQRAVVRKALANDLHCEFDKEVDRFYALYARSLRDLGTPVFPKRFFKQLQATFGDACEIMTVECAGKPVASVMSFYYRGTVLPYYAGAADSARHHKAHDFMYWALISHAAKCGMQTFDFGRSKKDTGAYHFKRHWGCDAAPLPYEYYLLKGTSVPDLSPANPRYQRAIHVWRKLPLPVTRVIGPLLSRSLG